MYLALDTETTGLGYWDTAFCVTLAYRLDDEPNLISEFLLADNKNQMEYLYNMMLGNELVFHNAKFDVQKLEMVLPGEGPNWDYIHDTECLMHLVNEQQPKSLKRLAKDLLGEETDEAEVLRSARRKLGLTKKDGYDALPREVIEPYARKDAEYTLLLFEKLWPIVEADDVLLRLYREEQELMGVLYSMEAAGLGVDMEYVDSKTKELANEILEDDLLARDLAGDEAFNPASWQQITAALERRGIQVEGTSKAVLSKVDDELAQLILRLRHNTKLYGTYFKALQAESRGGVLHPNFKQWGTRGRRFSSGESDG